MIIYKNIKQLLTLKKAAKKQARNIQKLDLSIVKDAVMVSDKGKIVFVGTQKQFKKIKTPKAAKTIDLKGKDVIPGFVECHTHSVFAGDRSKEFEMRNQGVSYQEIARQGGGILSTVKATRKASKEELTELLEARVKNFIKQGVTTLEIKSGYGLNLNTEVKILEVIKAIKKPQIVSTFLGAHAVPKEYVSSDDYIKDLINKHLPKVAKLKLADRVDIFIEKGYFTPKQAKKYFNKAQELGFKVMAHTEQLNRTGGFKAAIDCGAESIDHVVELTASDIIKVAQSESTCVLLPAADFYIKCTYPPAKQLIAQGARVALATDFNPGTSPTQNLSFVGLLARLEMKMTLSQVIVAMTLGGAYALGMQSKIGSLEVGKSCDFVVLDESWEQLFYNIGHHPVSSAYWRGRKIF